MVSLVRDLLSYLHLALYVFVHVYIQVIAVALFQTNIALEVYCLCSSVSSLLECTVIIIAGVMLPYMQPRQIPLQLQVLSNIVMR